MKSKKTIQDLTDLVASLKSDAHKKVVISAIHEITRLNDENASVWLLLDEIKAADIKNYKTQLEAAIAEKMLSALTLQRKKLDEPN